jgi:predicted DCC family thiol-disulfide oxidoreductase YuxK
MPKKQRLFCGSWGWQSEALSRQSAVFNCMTPSVTVWYDGACPLCQREITLMRRLDKRGAISFIDVADECAACPIERATLLARFHALEDGVMVSGAAAFAAMWRAIPILRPIGLLARNRVILKILDWLYPMFLKIRPRLQKLLSKK